MPALSHINPPALLSLLALALVFSAAPARALPSVIDAAHLCHCAPANHAGVRLAWAERHWDRGGGPYAFNCHYGLGPDFLSECGYSLLGNLAAEFAGSDCPETVAHLFC